jgi:hypothetical protein
MYAVVNGQEQRKVAAGQLCVACGKNDRGQKYADDKELRHRRFYWDFEKGIFCGPCVKTIGGRCGK